MQDGIEILEERAGTGPEASQGDIVRFDCAVALDQRTVQAKHEQKTWLGSRRIAPGVTEALRGMRPGGYRRVRVAPHLAFGSGPRPKSLRADSVLEYELWLNEIHTTVAEV
jgi:FKBP-type peptidyl-prolyl cis-trans isomerase